VYPFLFTVPEIRPADGGATDKAPVDPFFLFANRVGDTQLDGKQIWTAWDDPANDLMPHVARFLKPEYSKPTGRFWQLGNDIAQKLQTNKIEWRMLRGKTATPISFTLGGDFVLQLALFRHGVGFLTVSAKPASTDLGDWLAFLHDFRFMQHRSNVRVCAEQLDKYDPVSKQKTRAAYCPLGISGATGDQSFGFMDVIEAVLKASGLGTPEDHGHDHVFTPGHTLPYTGLFVRGVAETEKVVTLHRLRNFFGPDQGANASAEDLCVTHPAHLIYAQDQWFIQTLNGGSFLSFEDESTPVNAFQKEDLPRHARGVYFCANLLVLYQRFALARLSDRVATKALDGGDVVWEAIRDDLLDFTARGYFTQAMQSDHHHRYYRKWQEVLQIPQLYSEVRNEVEDLYERAMLRLRQADDRREKQEEREREEAWDRDTARDKREEEREKRVEKRLSLLGLLFAVPALILGVMGVNISGYTCGDDGLPLTTVLGWLVAGFILAALAYWFLVTFRDKDEN
jgi:hypothetical protein